MMLASPGPGVLQGGLSHRPIHCPGTAAGPAEPESTAADAHELQPCTETSLS